MGHHLPSATVPPGFRLEAEAVVAVPQASPKACRFSSLENRSTLRLVIDIAFASYLFLRKIFAVHVDRQVDTQGAQTPEQGSVQHLAARWAGQAPTNEDFDAPT